MQSDRRGLRRTKREGYYCKDNKEAQQRRNDIRRLALAIVDATHATFWRDYDKAERATIRATATQMYDLGVDYVSAERSEKVDRRGFVYVISHPAFPGYVKIGRAFNPESRLRGYQTGCPERRYRLYAAVYFEDCYFGEKEVHARLNEERACGEWFAISPFLARHNINKVRSIV